MEEDIYGFIEVQNRYFAHFVLPVYVWGKSSYGKQILGMAIMKVV